MTRSTVFVANIIATDETCRVDTAIVAFGAAILGAFAGGLAAALGSDWAQVRQLRRAARIHMFSDLLSEFNPESGLPLRRFPRMTDIEPLKPSEREVLDALRRSAVVAGKTEVELVACVREAWEIWRPPLSSSDVTAAAAMTGLDSGLRVPAFTVRDRDAEKLALDEAVVKLSDHLEKSISRHRGARR